MRGKLFKILDFLNQGIAQDGSVDTAEGHSFSVHVNYSSSYRVPDCKIV